MVMAGLTEAIYRGEESRMRPRPLTSLSLDAYITVTTTCAGFLYDVLLDSRQ